MISLVDDYDYDLVSQYHWTAKNINGSIYAIRSFPENGKQKAQGMHVLIMGRKRIDHIDNNSLNNQRYNLRADPGGRNQHNQRPQVGTSSKYKGVQWNKGGNGSWRSMIGKNGVSVYLGRFKSEIDAALAYDEKAKELHGEWASLNRDFFPEIKEAHQQSIAIRTGK